MSDQTPPSDLAPAGGRLHALIAALTTWAPIAALIGLSPGFYLWTVTHLRRAPFVYRNDLTPGLRGQLLAWMGLSLLLISALAVIAWRRRRRSEPALSLAAYAQRLSRDLIGLLALPFIAALAAPKIESEHPNLTLLHAALASAFVALGVYRLAARPFGARERLLAAARRLPTWLPFALVVAIFGGYSVVLARFALIDHWNIWTQVYDLGIYDNLLWHTIHGNFLGSSFLSIGDHTAAHFDPLLVILTPFYALWPRAETLLVFQSIWLGAGVFPLYLLARDRLARADSPGRGAWYGLLFAALYAAAPALHGVNMFDFHSVALAIPLMIWVVYMVDRRATWGLALALILLLTAREDMPLLASFIAFYALARGQLRAGLGILGASLAYLAFVKLVMMPDPGLMMNSEKVYGYATFYSEMIPRPEEGVTGLVKNALSNPVYVIKVVAKEEKLRFLVQLFLPLLFLPLFAGRARILWIYGLFFIGTASRQNMYSLNFQYSAVFFPMLYVAAIDAFARVGESPRLGALGVDPSRLRAALVGGLIAATSLTTYKFGVFIENSAFMAGWQPLIRQPDEALQLRYRRLQEMIAQVPADAAIAASSEIGAQVSNRARAYRWPDVRDAEYLLLGAWRFEGKERQHFDRIRATTFEVIDEHDGIYLLRRRARPVAAPPPRRPAGQAPQTAPEPPPAPDLDREGPR